MIKNNNKKIMKKMIKNSIFNHKAKSIMTVVSIVLTCILLTSVFTISMSLLESSEYTNSMQIGTLSHGGYKHLTEEEVDNMKTHHLIKSYGVSTVIGLVDDERLIRRSIEVRTMDSKYMSDSFVTVEGSMPKAYNEIILDTITLDLLGLPHKVNQEVTIPITVSDGIVTDTFIIVGIYDGNIYSHTSYMIMSEVFKEKFVSGKIGPDMLGSNNLSVNFVNKYNISEKLYTILADNNYAEDIIRVGVNWAYVNDISMIQASDLMIYIMLIVMLMFSGYLIISNIYLISINKDINHYGLLKTLGATQKQLRQLIYGQAFTLYLISLPIGSLIGYLLGIILVPVVLNTLNVLVVETSFNLMIFIFAAVLTGVTVFVSCRKPAKIASKVSPLEAIKAVDTNYVYSKKVKKRKLGNKLYRMAWQNVFRVKKKALLVIVSLTLSLLILCSIVIIVDDFNPEEHLNSLIGSDYLIANASYFTYRNDGQTISDSLINELSEEDIEIHPFSMHEYDLKVTDKLKEKIRSVDNNTNSEEIFNLNSIWIESYGMDDFIKNKLKEFLVKGEIPEVIKENQIILDNNYFGADGSTDSPFDLGEVIDFNGRSYEIIALVDDLPLYLYDQSYTQYGLQVFMMNDETVKPMTLMVEGDLSDIKEDLLKSFPRIEIKSRYDYIDQMAAYIKMIKIIGISLSSILAVIGILNFINMTSTGILVRKREFAIMQSIGMTSKQLQMMLYFEGLYVILLSLALMAVLSVLVSYMITGGFVTSYILIMLLMSICYIVVVSVIPHISYKYMSTDSIVRRLSVVD